MSNINENQSKNSISESYKTVLSIFPPNDMRLIVRNWFESFLKQHRKKKANEKCVQFFIYRQALLARLYPYLGDWEDWASGNSLMDYIDMTLSKIFFDEFDDKCALSERVDNEFYFCMLAFALDRIEFPSLVQDSFKQSYYLNNRNKVDLRRRNYLATTMFVARNLVNSVIESIVSSAGDMPTFAEIERVCRKNMWHLNNYTAVESAKSTKLLDAMKIGDAYRLYRGYEIESNQDVIVDRKVRLQDANKSISFTTQKRVATSFANYRLNKSDDPESTTLDDRITLAESMFDDEVSYLKKCTQKKCIVSEYLVNESDIVFYPMTTTITECEVFAVPDRAHLTRYTIVNSIN